MIRTYIPLLALLLAACVAHPGLRRGDQLAAQGHWRPALEAYTEALEAAPGDPDAQARVEGARAQLADSLVADARTALRIGETTRAEKLLDEARSLVPGHAGMQAARVELAAAWAARAEELAERDPVTAHRAAKRAVALAPDDAEARTALDHTRKALVMRLYDDATTYEKNQRYGAALVAVVRASEIAPRYRDLPQRIDALRQAAAGAASFTVELGPIEGRGREAHKLASRLVERLYAAEPPMTCPSFRVAAADLSGRGYRLTGTLLDASVRSSKWTEVHTREYQDGTRTVDNPERAPAEADVAARRELTEAAVAEVKRLMEEVERKEVTLLEAPPHADVEALQREVEGARSALSGAKQQARELVRAYRAAQAHLRDTPKTIEEPVMKSVDLDVVDVTRTFRLRLQVDVQDLARETPAWSKRTFEAKAESHDTTHRAVPKAGIERDPLKIPKSAAELREEALAALENELLGALAEQCRAERHEMRQAGLSLVTVGDMVGATDWFVRALLQGGGAAADTDAEAEAEIRAFFSDRWGIEDISPLIRR